MNIGEVLKSFKPYIIGIRFVEEVALLDVIFKNNWQIIEDDKIKMVKSKESEINYYMVYSENNELSIDDLLVHIRKIIDLNLEKEETDELLKIKIIELKRLFSDLTLADLKKLKFVVGNETITNLQPIETHVQPIETHVQPIENNLSEEEKEMIEEELRREKNMLLNKRKIDIKPLEIEPMIEIPEPIINEFYSEDGSCNCGPNEACSLCIDTKY